MTSRDRGQVSMLTWLHAGMADQLGSLAWADQCPLSSTRWSLVIK